MRNVENKEVTVLGLGMSGFSASKLLLSKGRRVKVSEINDNPAIKERLKILMKKGITFEIGKHSDEFILSSDLIVISPGVVSHLPLLEKARMRGIPVISEIELAYRLSPSSKIIAITGTNGKTTTVKLISHLLKKTFRVHEAGNLPIPFSDIVERIKKDDVVVLELSSFQLKNIVSFRPYISALLNIPPDHLDVHTTIEDYINSLYKIFSNQREEDLAIINMDYSPILTHREEKFLPKFYYFSSHEEVSLGIYCKNGEIIFNEEGVEKKICSLEGFSLPGVHNLENCLVGAFIGHILGLEKKEIEEGLSSFKNLPHRLERIGEIKGIEFINDSKSTNIDSVIKALATLPSPIILIMGGKDKGNDYSGLKKYIKEKVKILLSIGESRYKIKKALEDTSPTFIHESLHDAVECAFTNASDRDRILLSPGCASFDMFKDYEERGNVFKKIFERLKKMHE